MDRLTALLERFPPTVRVLFSDTLCERFDSIENLEIGHIHWLKAGELEVYANNKLVGRLTEPGIVFCPAGASHALVPNVQAEVICAEFEFGQRFHNPLINIEPSVVLIPISQAPEIEPVHSLLMKEAFSSRCGKSFGVNQLLQYFILIVFRFLIRTQALPFGLTKALADPKLLKAITSMHNEPARNWTLDSLADIAGMSRASFANHFKHATQTTPIDYLTDWRISLVQSKISSGGSIKSAARELGFSSPATLTRVFTKRVGCSPRDWVLQLPNRALAGR